MGSFSVDFPLVAQRGFSCLTLARMMASDSCGTIPSQLGRNHTVYGNYCRNLESLILLEILSLEQARWSGRCMLGAWVGFVVLCEPLAELH